MVRGHRSNITQRRKHTKEPAHALYDDIDNQPRIHSLTSLTAAQRQKKAEDARREHVTRQIVFTRAMLKKRIRQQRENGDDRIYTEVLMDLDEGDRDDFVAGGSGFASDGDDVPVAEDPDEWEEEEATEEEQLIYIRTKGGVQDYDLKTYRTRKTKGIIDQARWDHEMPELVEAYLDYCFRRKYGGVHSGQVKEKHVLMVWSTFGHPTYEVPVYSMDTYHNTSYIRSGYLPFNPLVNKSLVSLETVELYHHLFMRCPRLGIQPFIRTLCDLQGLRFKNNLAVQFSSAYDLYNRLVAGVNKLVMGALDRDKPNWRMLNACPPCQYEVEGEMQLPIRMLIAMDGNNSLKRLQRREQADDGTRLGPSKERLDSRVGGGDYFLQPEAVDLWDESQWDKWPGWTPKRKGDKGSCEERWSNLNEAKTNKTFGYFDVNGVFAGFCRHSFVLVFLDMVKTGEQSKYMLALLHHFMSACREDRQHRGLPDPPGSLGAGYDIACGMIDKIAGSPLCEIARDERLQMFIGLLHGYAHNRLCQLSFLMLYIYGAGIEDLETCERYFSHSNALAPVTRYMSKFHRRQAIANYAYHRDNYETYHNLSRFLYSNYKQALSILNRSKDTAKTLKAVGLLDDTGKAIDWLAEEREFLESRKTVPQAETLSSAYYWGLVKLFRCQDRLRCSRTTFRQWNGLTVENGDGEQGEDALFLTERQMLNEQEIEAKLLADIHSLEDRMGLRRDQRWSRGSEEWKKAEELVRMAKYQKALDRLEGLVVARIFELSRMNVSGTGYKMRQHIGQAMKKRCKTIQSALADYNEAAAKLIPPRKLLDWNDVMNYTYLSEFDFLCDARIDIRETPWARPAVREAMSELFKLVCSGEELDRLHVEIQRLFTYMKEEEECYSSMVRKTQLTNPQLALQIHLHGNKRQRFNDVHRMRLQSITKLKGFSPSNVVFFRPGVGLRRQYTGDGTEIQPNMRDSLGTEAEEDDESEGEDEEADADDQAEAVLGIANDL